MKPTNPTMYPVPMDMDVGHNITPGSNVPGTRVKTCIVACKAVGHCDEGIIVLIDGEAYIDQGRCFIDTGILRTPPKAGMTRTEAIILGQWVRTYIRDMPGKSVTHTDSGMGSMLILFSDKSYYKVQAADDYDGCHDLDWENLTLRDLRRAELVTDEDWANHERESHKAAVAEQVRSGRRLLAQAVQFMGRKAIREAIAPTVLEEEVSMWERQALADEERKKAADYRDAVQTVMDAPPSERIAGMTIAEQLDKEVSESLD
ncbi:MAG: hypothetical protein ACYS7Y_04200 [Planctomycetota bacterium]